MEFVLLTILIHSEIIEQTQVNLESNYRDFFKGILPEFFIAASINILFLES